MRDVSVSRKNFLVSILKCDWQVSVGKNTDAKGRMGENVISGNHNVTLKLQGITLFSFVSSFSYLSTCHP